MEHRVLIAWIGIASFATAGILVLRFATQIQSTAVRRIEQTPGVFRAISFPSFVQSKAYPRTLRAVGIICLLLACLMIRATYK